MEDVIKLLQRQLTMQQQQMNQMVSVLNGISAQLPQKVSAPNIPGWPSSGTTAPAAVFTTPPPGFGVAAATSSGISMAIPRAPLAAVPTLPPAAMSTPPPVPLPPIAAAIVQPAAVPGITPLQIAPGGLSPAGLSPAHAVAAPLGGSSSALPTQAFTQQVGYTQRNSNNLTRLPTLNRANSDADDEEPPHTPDRFGTPGGSRGRGRGRSVGLTRDIRERRSRTLSTEAEDENDGYAVNRERRETTCKSIPLRSFSLANKDQEFPIWIEQFEDAVNRGHNPHSLRRHHNYCLQWLPGSLETDAYAIWKECHNARNNWVELKKELEEKFEDPAIRKEWRSNPKALMWNEHGETLQSFLAKVKRKVNTYDSDIAKTEEARAALYTTRFTNGMPDDYINHLNLNMPTKKQKVEKALEICVRFQAYKKGNSQSKSEVGASVAFQDPTMPSRVTKTEMDIIRLGNRLKAMEDDRSNAKPPQDPDQARTYMAGRSPGRPFRPNWQGG